VKLYLAAIYTSNFTKDEGNRLFNILDEREKEARRNLPHILESYHYIHRKSFVEKIRYDKVKVFLDSGAFSDFTKGKKTNIDAYAKYVQENQDIIEHASVLDGIGDPQETYNNQKYLESKGLNVLPCYHFGEDERWLEYYIDNYDYITIGGMVPISTPQLLNWLDRIWDKYLTDEEGRPVVKVHGFGLTTYKLMFRYPWYSVDSSTWVQTARAGSIFMPTLKRTIAVSDRSPARKIQGAHIDSITEKERNALIKQIEKEGYNIDRLRTMYQARWAYCCWAFSHLGEIQPKDKRFKTKQPELF